MNLANNQTVLIALLILIALVIGWTILRRVAKLAKRLFAVGCLALVALLLIGWLIGWLR
jgi:hypothetical protein